jgi:hypothetical protein
MKRDMELVRRMPPVNITLKKAEKHEELDSEQLESGI